MKTKKVQVIIFITMSIVFITFLSLKSNVFMTNLSRMGINFDEEYKCQINYLINNKTLGKADTIFRISFLPPSQPEVNIFLSSQYLYIIKNYVKVEYVLTGKDTYRMIPRIERFDSVSINDSKIIIKYFDKLIKLKVWKMNSIRHKDVDYLDPTEIQVECFLNGSRSCFKQDLLLYHKKDHVEFQNTVVDILLASRLLSIQELQAYGYKNKSGKSPP